MWTLDLGQAIGRVPCTGGGEACCPPGDSCVRNTLESPGDEAPGAGRQPGGKQVPHDLPQNSGDTQATVKCRRLVRESKYHPIPFCLTVHLFWPF